MLDHRYTTFAILAQNLSYTETAKKLYISQPAVSQQIKSLETELNLKLVEYNQPHLNITTAGQQLASLIVRTEHSEAKLLQELQNGDQARQLQFGATHSISTFMVPSFIQKIKHQYPQIKCVVANTQQVLQQIDDGTLNFALVEGNFDKTRYGYQVVGTEEFVAATYPSNQLLQKSSISIEDLLDQTLLVRENGSGTREIFTNWINTFNAKSSDFHQVIEMGSAAGLVQLLKTTGISFMYKSLIEPELANNQLVTLDVAGLNIMRPISLVYAKDSFFEAEYQKLFE